MDIGRILQLFKIPTEVFACYSKSSLFTVKRVEGFEMREDGSTHFGEWKCRRNFSARQKIIDITENPRRAMCAATEHYSCRAGQIKHRARFLRRINVTVCE